MYLFFFQAEGGIRDIGVTGVQTCALPIYLRAPRRVIVRPAPPRPGHRPPPGEPASPQRAAQARPATPRRGRLLLDLSPPRSAERRVGKECRSRWSPNH